MEHRNLALPLPRYPRLSGFTEANTAYIEVAVELGQQAVQSALEERYLQRIRAGDGAEARNSVATITR